MALFYAPERVCCPTFHKEWSTCVAVRDQRGVASPDASSEGTVHRESVLILGLCLCNERMQQKKK